MSRYLDVEGSMHLSSASGPMTVIGQGSRVDIVLPSGVSLWALGKMAMRGRSQVPRIRSALRRSGLEVRLQRNGRRIATLDGSGSRVHWIDTIRSGIGSMTVVTPDQP